MNPVNPVNCVKPSGAPDGCALPTVVHEVDLCVVGGGIGGLLTANNHQRLIRGAIRRECLAIRLVPLATWGSDLKQETYGSATVHLFAFEPV